MLAPRLHEQFADLDKQEHAARLGMWIFLGSETMLFAALFALYAAYRVMYPAEFAIGVGRDNLAIGTLNLVILLTTSLAATLGREAARGASGRRAAAYFLFCAAGGIVFLVLKGVEYFQHFHEGIYPGPAYHDPDLPGRGMAVFFTLYFYLTGLHGAHLLVGIGLILWLAASCLRGLVGASGRARVENVVLYWHIVDVFWMFLWPLFYLTRA